MSDLPPQDLSHLPPPAPHQVPAAVPYPAPALPVWGAALPSAQPIGTGIPSVVAGPVVQGAALPPAPPRPGVPLPAAVAAPAPAGAMPPAPAPMPPSMVAAVPMAAPAPVPAGWAAAAAPVPAGWPVPAGALRGPAAAVPPAWHPGAVPPAWHPGAVPGALAVPAPSALGATGAWTTQVSARPARRTVDRPDTARRLVARGVDMAVVGLVTYLALLPFGLFSPLAVARPQPIPYASGHVVMLVVLVVTALAEPLAVGATGRTLGKYLVGLEVRTSVGTPVTWGVAFRRHLPTLLVRGLWAVSVVVMLQSAATDPFERGVQQGQAGALGLVVLIANVALLAVNLVMVLTVGRSLSDICGGTEVVPTEGRAPLADVLPTGRPAR